MNTEYSFYAETYCGSSVTESMWNRLSVKAEHKLDQFTFGRMPDKWNGESWEEKAKFAVCDMVEVILYDEKKGGITSENNDGYSVSYDTSESISKKLYDIAYSYLCNTGLMDLSVEEYV